MRKPEKENYFIETGETEFGKMHIPTGHFDMDSYERDLKEYNRLYYPNGKKRETPLKEGRL